MRHLLGLGQSDSVLDGPDLTRGIRADSLADGNMLVGRVGSEAVLVARVDGEFFATGAACTHYGAPLRDGLLVGATIRCPWHHARFGLASGSALCAPALNPIATWEVTARDGMIYVGARREVPDGATRLPGQRAPDRPPGSVVIIGAGAAGSSAAEMLRRLGYEGPVSMIGAEPDLPYDRPNLSKDYLAGDAPEEWIPLRSREFYDRHAITVISGVRATGIDPVRRRVALSDGRTQKFDRLLIATGSTPVRLGVPGSMRAHVHYLRSLSDSRAIIAAAQTAKRAVVVGASFIGLEVAASLRKRGLEVHVVGRGQRPLEHVFGAQMGDMIRTVHESQGVVFHLGTTISAIDEHKVTLTNGGVIPADVVIIGVGVRPQMTPAEGAGLAIDGGILVNEYLETNIQGIFAAGDVARWPDAHTAARIRVEHWVVAQRQGQLAARNMLAGDDHSRRERFDAVPFFWSRHYDLSIRYVGHAERWDEVDIDGDLSARDATVAYRFAGRTLAIATIGRDRAGLLAELAMETAAQPGLDSRPSRRAAYHA
jgi:NADPH-dependent 2,4-dienoyl-CoA reductase/sulfur reductase-like enzyme/nitrite reductase/ring-hydroxylating ferredoxin subunit